MNQTITDTLSKPQIRKMTPYAREEKKTQNNLNGSTLFPFCEIPGSQDQAYYLTNKEA